MSARLSGADEPCTCLRGPNADGPEENCPQHGRPYAYWVERGDALQARLAAVEALADGADEKRLTCASDPDCPCSYKDCYECGKWHNCTHTPWAAIRAALSVAESPGRAEGDAGSEG